MMSDSVIPQKFLQNSTFAVLVTPTIYKEFHTLQRIVNSLAMNQVQLFYLVGANRKLLIFHRFKGLKFGGFTCMINEY